LGAAAVALLLFGAPTASSGGNKFGEADGTANQVVECTDDDGTVVGTISYDGPAAMWPPNHKDVTAAVWATSTDDGDEATLTGTALHDQATSDTELDHNGDGEVDGSGHTPVATDAQPAAFSVSGTPTAGPQEITMRAERSGRVKDGRTYTIAWTATFEDSDNDGSVNDADGLQDSPPDPTVNREECSGDFTVHVPHDMRGGASWKE
jgi:hypothetical protein